MQVWLFQANKDRFNLIEKVPTLIGKSESWSATIHLKEMRVGDVAIFWQSGPEAGVYALGKLLSESYEEPASSGAEPEWRVDNEFTELLETPILKIDLIDDPILQNLQVVRMPRGKNPFRVTDTEWLALQEMIAGIRTGLQDELVEASIRFEQDIEDHLIHNLDAIEPGLKYVDRQVISDVGRIDILAKDRNGERVVIEVKGGDAKDAAVGQIARYLGWYTRLDGKAPRGLLVAAGFPENVQYAAIAVHKLTLVAYKVHFSFQQTTI